MNYSQSSLPVRALMNLSFFHAAYEGLLVNELRSTRLVDHKVSPASSLPFQALSDTRCLFLCSTESISKSQEPPSSRRSDSMLRCVLPSLSSSLPPSFSIFQSLTSDSSLRAGFLVPGRRDPHRVHRRLWDAQLRRAALLCQGAEVEVGRGGKGCQRWAGGKVFRALHR